MFATSGRAQDLKELISFVTSLFDRSGNENAQRVRPDPTGPRTART